MCITVGSNLTSKYGTPIEEKPTVQLNLDVFADRDMYILTSMPGTTGHACRIRTKSWRMHTLDLKHENKVDSRRVDTKELVEVPRECLVHLCDLRIIQKRPVADHQFHLHVQVVDAVVREVKNVVQLERELEHQRLWRLHRLRHERVPYWQVFRRRHCISDTSTCTVCTASKHALVPFKTTHALAFAVMTTLTSYTGTL